MNLQSEFVIAKKCVWQIFFVIGPCNVRSKLLLLGHLPNLVGQCPMSDSNLQPWGRQKKMGQSGTGTTAHKYFFYALVYHILQNIAVQNENKVCTCTHKWTSSLIIYCIMFAVVNLHWPFNTMFWNNEKLSLGLWKRWLCPLNWGNRSIKVTYSRANRCVPKNVDQFIS